MAKSNPRLTIRLDLLKPQSNPQKIPVKLIHWLLSTGRFIFVLVEAIVLIAFILRFKLDADIAAKKEAIENQIPYIQSLKPYEIIIKEVQLKLSTIGTFNQNAANFSQIFQSIADQTPGGVKITTINLEKNVGKITIQISAQAQSNNDLVTFVSGMKEEKSFHDVNLTSVALEQGVIRFSLAATTNLSEEGKSL